MKEHIFSEVVGKRTSGLLGPLNDVEKKSAPKSLFMHGDLSIFQKGPRVSIVGTRNPSEEGKNAAILLTRLLVEQGIVILSGLAKGIDTFAHKTAINEKGYTIAVLGTPLSKSYPPENKELQRIISEKQLVISQFPEGTPIQKKNFPLRNRTMALISHATIIVEAGKTSGTVHQGWEALRLGRPLFIVKSLFNKGLIWPEKMLEYGAIPLSLKYLDSVFERVPFTEGEFKTNVHLST
jgi:DNA processing protein